MIPGIPVRQLYQSRIEFGGHRPGPADACGVEVAADRHVKRVSAGIGTIIILGDGDRTPVHAWVHPVARAAEQGHLDHTFTRHQRVIGPADGCLSRPGPSTQRLHGLGSREGILSSFRVRFDIDRHARVVEAVMAGDGVGQDADPANGRGLIGRSLDVRAVRSVCTIMILTGRIGIAQIIDS